MKMAMHINLTPIYLVIQLKYSVILILHMRKSIMITTNKKRLLIKRDLKNCDLSSAKYRTSPFLMLHI